MVDRSGFLRLVVAAAVLAGLGPLAVASDPPTPREQFGFQPGDDRRLVDYEQLTGYLEVLDASSPRLEMREVGRTPLDRPMYVAFISAPENIARLEELRSINERLAVDPTLGSASRDQLIERGRVFVMATLSMHSGEVGPSQALPIMAHELATTEDPAILAQLEDVVLMIVPCHNPDGMDMVVENYRKYAGTKFEGASLPGVYHRYVGHDNNRDFVTLTQADTRVINRLFSTEWYPQVLVEKHQMMNDGPRYYVPPSHDPIAENIDQGLWNWTAVFGSHLAREMGRDGLSGVAQHWLFDDYWPGSTETSLWKNVISFLTECASCRTAAPVFVERNELTVEGKGLAEYKKSTNMPDPWPGGWWRLSDIVRYEISSMHSILATAALSRREILAYRNDRCRAEVELGRTTAPYAFVLPAAQHDRGELVELVRLLQEHGVKVFRLGEAVTLDGRAFSAGDLVVPLNQPYRPFIKEVMESQSYPVRHYTPDGEIIKPYDITSWSLPLHKGLISCEISTHSTELERNLRSVVPADLIPERTVPENCWAVAYTAAANLSFRAAFTARREGLEVLRLPAAARLAGTDFPAGSFLIRVMPETHDHLQEIADSVPIAPVVVDQPVAAAVPITNPRIALVETWFHDMDAGWTRFIFDGYGIPFTVVRPGDFEKTDFAADFDVVVFPDADKDVLMKGHPESEDGYRPVDLPPEYAKGIGDKGMEGLMAFLDGGGLIVAWRRSVPLFLGPLKIKHGKDETETFQLPVRDLSKEATAKGLQVPGSFLAIDLLEDHPLTYGMPAHSGVFSRGMPLLQTAIPILDMDRRVVARFPENDLLLSGYAEKAEVLAGKPAMVWVRKGKGQLVLMSFNPQFRASTPASYKLLFNALLLADRE